jgi:hypothetical protein
MCHPSWSPSEFYPSHCYQYQPSNMHACHYLKKTCMLVSRVSEPFIWLRIFHGETAILPFRVPVPGHQALQSPVAGKSCAKWWILWCDKGRSCCSCSTWLCFDRGRTVTYCQPAAYNGTSVLNTLVRSYAVLSMEYGREAAALDPQIFMELQ